MSDSPSSSVIHNLAFWDGDEQDITNESFDAEASPPKTPAVEAPAPELFPDKPTRYGASMYVKIFEEMLSTIAEHEWHLLSPDEQDLAKAFIRLSYGGRYLLSKLALRSHKWHRLQGGAHALSSYAGELGDKTEVTTIHAAIAQLCGQIPLELEPWMVEPMPLESWGPRMAAERADAAMRFDKAQTPKDSKPRPVPPSTWWMRKPAKKSSPPDPDEVIDLTGADDDNANTNLIDELKNEPLDENISSSSAPHVGITLAPPAAVKAEPVDPSMPAAGPSSSLLAQVDTEVGSSSQIKLEPQASLASEPDMANFGATDSDATLPDLLGILSNGELKDLSREHKLRANGTSSELVEALLAQVGKSPDNSRATPKKGPLQTTLDFGINARGYGTVKLTSQADRLRTRVLQLTGTCIRLHDAVVEFFRRMNLLYFRGTQYTHNLLTPAVLARSKKRYYVAYEYKRTVNIWERRDDFLAYEQALILEAQVDALLDGSTLATRAPRKLGVSSVASSHKRNASRRAATQTPKKRLKTTRDTPVVVEEEEEEDTLTPRQQAAQEVVKLINDQVLPVWRELVHIKSEAEPRTRGLERFESGHVLTRIVGKGAVALGLLQKLDEAHLDAEDVLLAELLGQKRWRRGRRGRWWDRRITLAMKPKFKDEAGRQRALVILEDAIRDPDTHLLYRPKFDRHMTTIEKALQIPEADRHSCEGVQYRSTANAIQGTRVRPRTASLSLDSRGRALSTALETTQRTLAEYGVTQTQALAETPEADKTLMGAKTIWVGRDGEHVSVETFALQHYEEQGYKGVHAEGSTVRVLFGLLFWDIIFAPVAGAFETPFQSAPLDLGDETFFHARADLVLECLEKLENKDGFARDHVAKIDADHRDKNTLCVGVHWKRWEREDLLDMVDCLGGPALATICRMQAENYVGTGGGVPDLFLWRVKDKSAKFVEVKSTNDKLSEKQKAWIHVMVRAGIDVEVCNVSDPKDDEAYVETKKTKSKKKSQSQTPAKKRAAVDIESEDETEQIRVHLDGDDIAGAEDDEWPSAPALDSKTCKRKRREVSPED